jgi:hypothetical protein
MREVATAGPALQLVPSGDPQRLAAAILAMHDNYPAVISAAEKLPIIDFKRTGEQLGTCLRVQGS